MAERVCPKCGHDCAAEAVLCVRCGTDLRTGRRLRTEVEARSERPLAELCRLAGEIVRGYLPGLLRPGLLIFLALTAATGLALLGAALLMGIFGLILLAFPVGGMGLLFYLQALAWLIGGDWALLPEHLAGFGEGHWLLFLLLAGLPFVLLFAAMKLFVL